MLLELVLREQLSLAAREHLASVHRFRRGHYAVVAKTEGHAIFVLGQGTIDEPDIE